MEAGPSKCKVQSIEAVKSANSAKSKEDDDSKSFPRCEYKARFKGTSAFNMSVPEYWGSYYRSTKRGGNYDRLSTIKSEEPKSVPQKRTTRRASSGLFLSPYHRKQYNLRSTTANANSRNNDGSIDGKNDFLYDQLLKYKCKLCNIVVEQFGKISRRQLNVFIQNDFPCIIVQLHLLNGKVGRKYLYQICAAYFSAITNYFAKKHRIPVEMVIRASIGHNIPSVSATNTSFRINIGIVPIIYVKIVLIDSLKLFNEQCDQMLTEKLLLNNLKNIQRINGEILLYNIVKRNQSLNSKQLEVWNETEAIITVLCKRGDSSGKTIANQITRLNQYIDLLCDYVHMEIMEKFEELHLLNAEPLRKLFDKLSFDNAKATMNVQNTDYIPIAHFEFAEEEHPEIKSDNEFWEIIQRIASVLQNVVGDKKLLGLYGMLEKANAKFINNCSQQCEDGYGTRREVP